MKSVETTGFTYSVRDENGVSSTASVMLNAKEETAIDDLFIISAETLTEAGSSFFRLAAKDSDTDLLQNDFGADEIIFIDGSPIQEGVFFNGNTGGQLRVFARVVIDFRNQGDRLDPCEPTGFTYGVLDEDGEVDTAMVTVIFDEFWFT